MLHTKPLLPVVMLEIIIKYTSEGEVLAVVGS